MQMYNVCVIAAAGESDGDESKSSCGDARVCFGFYISSLSHSLSNLQEVYVYGLEYTPGAK